MNVLDTIDLTKDQFTRADWAVYNVMSADWVRVFRNSSNALAKEYGLSQASVVRFCKRLGFEGYTDFRLALYNAIQSEQETEEAETKADCLKRLIDLISASDEDGAYDSFVQKLVDAGMVCTMGVHRSALPAQLLMLEMRLHDRASFFLPQDQQGAFGAGFSRNGLVVLFSEAGDSSRDGVEQIASFPKELRPTMALVCMDAKHPLRKYFDEVIVLPSSSNQQMPARVDPSTVFSFFVDLVSSHVAAHIGSTRK
ncbi:MAG: MurR/RpiR family transcriptional regulator [Atopobiaceae bacterium]|nr:MurR/RpiR family transcriptional regulator [Atopobiaceae bacterium]